MASHGVCSLHVQARRQDYISDLTGMTKALLKEFFVANRGVEPESLVMYRDGVSESHFEVQQVTRHQQQST